MAFSHLPANLKKDLDIANAACKSKGMALQFIKEPAIRRNRTLVMDAVKNCGTALHRQGSSQVQPSSTAVGGQAAA